SLENWMVRLTEHDVEFEGPFERFSEHVIGFRDPDGLRLEIVGDRDIHESDTDGKEPDAIRGFTSVTLCVETPDRTTRLLTETFGYRDAGAETDRVRFRAANQGEGALGAVIDVLCHPEAMRRRPGGGTVHHVAFRAQSEDELKAWRQQIVTLGFNVTPILDRQYFRSIYFREPGGILFEIATDPPGFAIDEEADRLGTTLKLPPWLEEKRMSIERRLPPVRLPGVA